MNKHGEGARAVTVFAGRQRIHDYFDPHAPRWRPGYPVPAGISPDAVVALMRHADAAEAHAREQQAARRPSWQKRRAA